MNGQILSQNKSRAYIPKSKTDRYIDIIYIDKQTDRHYELFRFGRCNTLLCVSQPFLAEILLFDWSKNQKFKFSLVTDIGHDFNHYQKFKKKKKNLVPIKIVTRVTQIIAHYIHSDR